MVSPIFGDMVSSVSTVITHPIDIVWPHLLNQAAWMKGFAIETVSGDRNKEGELKQVVPVGGQFQPFFFKTLLLVPFRKFVYKAYTDTRSGQYSFTGVEILSLSEFGKESAVTFDAFLEVQSGEMTRPELTEFIDKARDASAAMWRANFEDLNSLIAMARRLGGEA
jgi:hypothetical protein